MLDDGGAVVSVLGFERSKPGFESRRRSPIFLPHTKKKKKKKKKPEEKSAVPQQQRHLTAPSNNYSGRGPAITTITHGQYITAHTPQKDRINQTVNRINQLSITKY